MKNKQNNEGNALHIIGYSLLKARAIPLLLLFAAVIITNFLGYNLVLRYFGYALTVISISLYFIVGLRYRFDKSIIKPSEHVVYFPLAGKVSSIKEIDGKTRISVQKSVLNNIEIRSPHWLCRWDAGDLIIDEIKLQISFTEGNIKIFENESFRPGNIIGMAQGKVSYVVQLNSQQDINLKVGQELKASSSIITMLEYMPEIEVKDDIILANEDEE
ncbi:MAG: hypothetical protein LHW60_02975 [Candidatus Cloacimonetes bacterium]|mgnify:CR=1 FL=1|nr:hypothetical protein [Candidatus Cloacimonadota bacterium]